MIPNKTQTKGIWKNALGIYTAVALIALAFFAGTQVGYTRGKRAVVPTGEGQIVNVTSNVPDGFPSDIDFSLYWHTWNILKDRYIERPVSDSDLFYGSLAGMTAALGDPYTVFFDPKTNNEFRQELAGRFQGIGAEIGIKDNVITIIAPLPDTPAERAGLRAGDQIVSIDGTRTEGMTVEKAVTMIRGLKDTSVTLSIYRDGFDAPRDFTITRDEIVIRSVRTNFRDDGIAVLNIFQFGDETTSDFRAAVQEILTQNPSGLILDLRNNPGGYLNSAVDVAGEWVDAGEVVVVEQNKDRTEFKSDGPARLKNIPMVVLVNNGSASASEILAGALQDYGLARVLGTTTFGKGSVQDFEQFEDGSGLKYTIAEWLTPLGRSINKLGITPDEIVEFNESDARAGEDPQLNRAIEFLNQ